MKKKDDFVSFLVIEDHSVLRRSMNLWLSGLFPHSEIREANSGEVGLNMAESAPPDIVIVDIGLPGINGINVTRLITKKKLKTKVIILSVLDGADYRKDALNAGAWTFVSKKDMYFKLPEAIKEIIDRR